MQLFIRPHKLTKEGISHFIVPMVLFIILFGAIGTYLYVKSQAAVATTTVKNGLGNCMADHAGGSGVNTRVEISHCSGDASSQSWQTGFGQGQIQIHGNCLGTSGNNLNPGAVTVTLACSKNGQLQSSVRWTSISGELVNAATITKQNPTGYCLDSANQTSGTQLQLALCTGSQSQKWQLTWGGPGGPPPPPPSACVHAVGPFRVSGTKVLQSNGKAYIPYGVTLSGLQLSNYAANLNTIDSQILGAANSWCSNTVRLQIEQDMLVGQDGKSLSQPLLGAIQQVVSYAKGLGLVVVLNAQTEPVPNGVTGNEPLPTTATEAFWKQLAPLYGNDPQVVFDLFNEPRPTGISTKDAWKLWQNGGLYSGKSYVSMQAVVTSARTAGARNLFWVEGIGFSGTFAGIPQLMSGGPIMYAIHHPRGDTNKSTWNSDFGFLVNSGKAPVVVGEWSNYAKVTTATGGAAACWPDAPKSVPKFLNYLAGEGIGMTVWTFNPGTMVTDTNNNYADATSMKSNFKCKDGLNQGSGSLVQSWFKKQNSA